VKYSYPHYHGPMRSDGTWPHPIPCDQLVCADKVADGTYPIDEHPKIGNLRFIDEAAREARGDEFFQNQQAQKAVEYAAERGVTLGEFHYKWIDFEDLLDGTVVKALRSAADWNFRRPSSRYELRTWAWGSQAYGESWRETQ
jgi:hypothetical protein